ncbi:MAG: glycerol dehydrogenase [Crocosphaera sp.]
MKAAIFPSRYVQGKGSLDLIGEELKRLGDEVKVLCLLSPSGLERFQTTIQTSVDKQQGKVNLYIEQFNRECSDEEIQRLVTCGQEKQVNLVMGVGGGKILDTAKAVANDLKTPVVIVPTIASNDAPCASVSVIYTPKGEFDRYVFLPTNPDLVLVDTQIIAESPVRLLVSGMGDALATWFEAEDCQISHGKNITGYLGLKTAYHLARFCYDMILEYGFKAKLACENKIVNSALENVVEANVLLSGLGFESGGLSAAHSIHNGLTMLEETHEFWHGEKVTIGLLAMLFLTERSQAIIDEVYTFCESVGLPTTLGQIGVTNRERDYLMAVAERACASEETIHNLPFNVTPEMVLDSLLVADQEGMLKRI